MPYMIGYVDIEEGVDTGLSANAKIREAFTNTQTALNGLDNRATTLEAFVSTFTTPIFTGFSLAASQLPSTTNTPLQVEFGAAQNDGTDDAMLAVDGTVTFNVTGTYAIDLLSHVGRSETSQAASIIAMRWLVNDIQLGRAIVTKIDDDAVTLPLMSKLLLPVTAGDTLKCEIVRDSGGYDSGGLVQTTLNASGWGDSPSAELSVKRFI